MGDTATNEVGNRYGMLTVIARAGTNDRRLATWLCKCDCGGETISSGNDLRMGKSTSCGCKKRSVVDETGNKYGKLTVVERAGSNKRGAAMWLCKCECGNSSVTRGDDLRAGKVKSCGCEMTIVAKNYSVYPKRLYNVWRSMINRCTYKSHPKYYRYGGRGISICSEWLASFASFADWALKHGYDSEAPYGACTLDRIDANGNYEPDNCRFADITVQNNNKSGMSQVDIYPDEKGIWHVAEPKAGERE